jgi:hypothetical protein
MKGFLCLRAGEPLRDALRPAFADKRDTPRDLGVVKIKDRARDRLTGIRTRGSPGPRGQ